MKVEPPSLARDSSPGIDGLDGDQGYQGEAGIKGYPGDDGLPGKPGKEFEGESEFFCCRIRYFVSV